MVQNFIFLLFFLYIIYLNLVIYPSGIAYFIGVDVISYGLILLSFWISGLMLISREKIYKYKNKLN